MDSDYWRGNLEGVQAVELAAEFFSAFTADAFVVSANDEHGHPHATTIVGLAIAVRNNARPKPTLYVTSARSMATEKFAYTADIL